MFHVQTLVEQRTWYQVSNVRLCLPLSLYNISTSLLLYYQAARRSRTPLRHKVCTSAAMPLDRQQREAWFSETVDPLLSEMVEV